MGKSQVEVAHLPAAGEGGKQMVDAERYPLLGEVREEGFSVMSPALDGRMLVFSDVEHTKVQLPPPRQLAGDFLAHEEIGSTRQLKGPFYRIVVGEGDEVHPTDECSLVHGGGLRVALADDPAQNGQGQGARVFAVDVEVAAHQRRLFCITVPPDLRNSCRSRGIKPPADCAAVKVVEILSDSRSKGSSHVCHGAVARSIVYERASAETIRSWRWVGHGLRQGIPVRSSDLGCRAGRPPPRHVSP